MVVSLNYQRLYDIYNTSSVHGTIVIWEKEKFTDKEKTDGSIKALSPALAVQVTPQLSFGLTLNIWTDNLFWENGWTKKMWYVRKSSQELFKLHTDEKISSFEGFNFNIGFLWDLNSLVTVGGVVKTPFTADLHRHYKQCQVQETPMTTIKNVSGYSENIEMSMPMSYGLGFAFRLSDSLTTSLDVYSTQWSRFFVKNSDGVETNPITGLKRSQSHMHDTTQVRAGIEYLIIKEKTVIPLRAGIFYDPQPSEKHPDDFFGFSLGTGITINNVILDCAYVFRYGNNVRGGTLGYDMKTDEIQHTVLMSIIYHFDR
jgi:long-subunit fatty acid transport protein